MTQKFIIDKETLKAIVVDTRLKILKLLHKRKYTLSELSKILNLSSSTIKEHLDILCKVNLIKKENSSRKWKYYSLTFKGLNLINPKETTALVTFALSSIITIGLTLFFVSMLFTNYTTSSVASYKSINSTVVYGNLDNQNTEQIYTYNDNNNNNNNNNLNVRENINEKNTFKDNTNKFSNFFNKNLLLSLYLTFIFITIILFLNYIFTRKKFK